MTKILPVHLRDDQYQDLSQHWVNSGQSMNESIRQGIDLFLNKIKIKSSKKNKGDV